MRKDIKMRKVYFDTETTDLTPGQIAQLSYIIEDDSTFVEAKNMFFTVDKMTSGAEGTHGMSVDFLAEASNGMTILAIIGAVLSKVLILNLSLLLLNF